MKFLYGVIFGILMFIACGAVSLEIAGIRFQPVKVGQGTVTPPTVSPALASPATQSPPVAGAPTSSSLPCVPPLPKKRPVKHHVPQSNTGVRILPPPASKT